MKSCDRITGLLEYAGPCGVAARDIGAICFIYHTALVKVLHRMERDQLIVAERAMQDDQMRRRYKLYCYGESTTEGK